MGGHRLYSRDDVEWLRFVAAEVARGPSAADAALHLVRNGIKAEPLDVAAGSRSVGEAILDHAASIGSDFLVKGAYTQSRLRQMIFGGATSHILAEADVPVFMAH